MIILEALFLTGGEKQELKYRLALRAAHFIGKSVEERRHYFDSLREAYDLRSKIVHGDAHERAPEIFKAVDAAVRLSMIEYLRRNGAGRERNICQRVCDEMDGYVLERSR
jgi:hypothetical protein